MEDYVRGLSLYLYSDVSTYQKLSMLYEKSMRESMVITLIRYYGRGTISQPCRRMLPTW